MKKIITAGLTGISLLLLAFAGLQAVNYQLADNYSIKFENPKAEGSFTKLKGNIRFNENHLDQCTFNMAVEVSSIKTGNFLKNSHAKGSNWFDADKYPLIKFTSARFSKTASGYEVSGNLEMHGVQKQVIIPFTFENNVFKGSFKLNRLDYKVGDMEGMSAKVPAEILIKLSIPVTGNKI